MYNPNNLPQPDWRDDRTRLRKGNPHIPRVERDPDRVADATETRISERHSASGTLIMVLHFVVSLLFIAGLTGLVRIIWTGDFELPLAMLVGLVGGVVWVGAMVILRR